MLDKKALRRFAVYTPAPAIPSGHGLLRAEQVDHIIRTDVKIIGHRRTLILFIFDRTQAAGGNPVPLWTMFHTAGDYVTLVREPGGTSRWREASFERLGKDYRFKGKCAFYSAKDEQRVCGFFHDAKNDGITALVWAQQSILDKRAQKRQRRRDQAVRNRMKCLPALPGGLAAWAHRNIMPAYFIYDHSKRGKAAGVCTSCGQEAALTDVKHNAEGTCPHCGRKLVMKPKGRIGRLYDRQTFQVLQRMKTGELAVRIMKATCDYQGENPGTVVYESARQLFRVDQDGTIHCEHFYYAYGESKWKKGERPVMFPYQYNFEADIFGHVYCDNLPKALSGTPWQYCPVKEFVGDGDDPMQMQPFLLAYIQHPRLEHLVKIGFNRLASDLAYGRIHDKLLDETQNRTHRILRVAAEDVDFLREMDVDADILRKFQQYAGVKDSHRLLLWQLGNKIARDIAPCLQHVTAHKLMRYVDSQYPMLQGRKTDHGWPRYQDIQTVVTEYKDYLCMCHRLGYNMKNSFVLYPKDLQKAHDRVQRRVKIKDTAKLREDFAAAMEAIGKHLDFESDGMMIVVPSDPDELNKESQALKHCVWSYADKIARRESIVLFIRMIDAPDDPYFTLEIKNMHVVQTRGLQNSAPPPSVQAFVDQFERQVLMAA